MPHRTVFQWGKNHAHPFTTFIGGVVIGALVTGVIAWSWAAADAADVEIEDVTVDRPAGKNTASPTPSVSPSASPSVTF